MPKYLLEATYTGDGVKGLKSEGGSARAAAATALVESLGGTVECFYFGFGGVDVYLVVDMPDNASVAAASLAVNSTGAITARTVVLLSPSEMDEAGKKDVSYRGPRG